MVLSCSCVFLSVFLLPLPLHMLVFALPAEGDYLSVMGALAVAVKYTGAINVLAGWAIWSFPPRTLIDRNPLSPPSLPASSRLSPLCI